MSKNKSRKKRSQSADDNPVPEIDRRALERGISDISRHLQEHEFGSIDEMNSFLQDLLKSPGPPPRNTARTPVEQAQDIMYDAWDENTPSKRVKLARKALSVSEDCADAYVLLADEVAKTPEEALEFYKQGVEAGERALGAEMFEENLGHFWGIVETRPYMRARAGLAECLWLVGKRQEAIAYFQETLRLNPNDNQGLRYILVHMLMDLGDDNAARSLMHEYEDDYSATWFFARPLLLFRKEGATRNSEDALQKAIEYNRFVPPYLLGRKKLPRVGPAYISPRGDTEAIDYVASAIDIWQRTDGALPWVRVVFDRIPPGRRPI